MTFVSRFDTAGLHFSCPKYARKQDQDAAIINKTLMFKCPYH